jgi:predicted dehydrogenase
MSAKKYNVGVVGYGWVAGAHIDAINATRLGQVTAVCSSRPVDAAALSAKHGGVITVCSDLATMLADPNIQVVDVCSLPSLHAAQAIAAAKAGKHLILEKPVALNWAECVEVQKAVLDAGIHTCVGFECRFSSQLLTTKAVIDRGLLGKIHYGEVDYFHGIGPWYDQFRWNILKQSGGSSLLSAGCHALDALLLCMGTEVETVSSYSTHSVNRDFVRYEYPTTSVTILKFKDGRVGKVASVIDCLQPYYFRVHLVGSEGTLLDNKFYSTQLGGLDKGKWSELSMKLLNSGDVTDHPYQTQFDAFFNALELDREMPLTSLAQAMRTMEIIFAADNSADRHAHRKAAH